MKAPEAFAEYSIPSPERIVLLENKGATNAGKVAGYILRLKDANPDLEYVTHSIRDLASLHEILLPGDILLPGGGDGTVNAAVNCVDKVPFAVPLLVGRFGNATEVAQMIGIPKHNPPADLSKMGVLSVHPFELRASFDNPQETGTDNLIAERLLASYCFSLGNTALAAEYYDRPEFRELFPRFLGIRKLGELAIAGMLTAMPHTVRIRDRHIEIEKTEPSPEQMAKLQRTISTVVGALGPQVARYAKPQVELDEPRGVIFEQGRWPHNIVGSTARMFTGNHTGDGDITPGSPKEFYIDSPTLVQIDGQWYEMPVGVLYVGLAEKPYYLLTPTHKHN